MTGEDFEADTPFCQIVHRINQMTQVAAESIGRLCPINGSMFN